MNFVTRLAVIYLGLISCSPVWASPPPLRVSKDALVILGPIGGGSVVPQMKVILERVAAGVKEQDLVISSPGGSIVAGFLFINVMEAAKAQGMKFRCFVPEVAASMAFGILVHCNERHALSLAFLLWHRARTNPGAVMTAPEAEKLAADLGSLDAVILEEVIAAIPEMSEEKVRYHFEGETLHLARNLHALAPSFITVHTYIPGVYEAILEAAKPKSIFGMVTPVSPGPPVSPVSPGPPGSPGQPTKSEPKYSPSLGELVYICPENVCN